MSQVNVNRVNPQRGKRIAIVLSNPPSRRRRDSAGNPRVPRTRTLILKAGVFDNMGRLLPPVTISDDDLEAGLEILDDALAAVHS